jgi:hypothetical protein
VPTPLYVNAGRPIVRDRRLDPALLAPLALIFAAVAIALEVAYTVGNFVLTTVHQLPVGS